MRGILTIAIRAQIDAFPYGRALIHIHKNMLTWSNETYFMIFLALMVRR